MNRNSRIVKMVETLYMSAASVCSEVLHMEKKPVRIGMIHVYTHRKIKKLHIYRIRLEEMKDILEQMRDTYSHQDKHKGCIKHMEEILQLLDEQNVLLMKKIEALENLRVHESFHVKK